MTITTQTSNQQADATFALLFALSTPFVAGLAYLGSHGMFNSRICSVGAVPVVVSGSWLIALVITVPLALGSYLIWRYFSARNYGAIYNALVSQVFCALIMHFGGGSGEAHFPFFIFTSFLLYYRDWKPIAIASVTIGLHHILFYGLQLSGTPVVLFSCLNKATLLGHLAAALVQGAVLSYIAVRMAKMFDENLLLNSNLVQLVQERTDELQVANSKLQVMSDTDGLTGLANRRNFDEVLANEWARASRTCQPLSFLMLDVDLFKQYNDHYGHIAGDECLRSIARELQQFSRRTGDLVARYGGEEFAIILPNMDERQAKKLAEEICLFVYQLAMPHQTSQFGMVTLSIGVSVVVNYTEISPLDLINRADQALYRAKNNGRNQVVLASEIFGPAAEA
jgi:diguanylate cyclase (GGDEF)-like protein